MMEETSEHRAATSRLHPKGKRPGKTRTWVIFGLVSLVVITIFAFSWKVSADAVESLVLSNNTTAAASSAWHVQDRMATYGSMANTFASLPGLVDGVVRHDEDAVRDRLRVIVESDPTIDRAFVVDPGGTLWSDFPLARESLGKNFSHREWYAGVSKRGDAYVSQTYVRQASPQVLLVAVATPVRVSKDSLAGYFVFQVLLNNLSAQMRALPVGADGLVMVLDEAGSVAAHPTVDLSTKSITGMYDEILGQLPKQKHAAATVVHDPLLQQDMLVTRYPALVTGREWHILTAQPTATAYAPLRALRYQMIVACALVLASIGALAILRERSHTRTWELYAKLEQESAETMRAKQALESMNADLERRVEERTREVRHKQELLLHSQKMEAVGQLAGGVAHDFNNLLMVINGYSQTLMEELKDRPDQLEQIQEIHIAGGRAAALTRQLLAFSRKQVLEPKLININESVSSMDKLLRRLIGEDIELETIHADNLGTARVDPNQLEQVIMNLAVNARDAMPRGGKLTIETGNVFLDEDYAKTHPEVTAGPHVLLAVSDNGSGMPEDVRKRIFEPFFTTKQDGRGTGLGLSMVHGIVKQSGGHIWVYSEIGKGTVFKVYFPTLSDTKNPHDTDKVVAALPAGTETILLVEDEVGVRKLLRKTLLKKNYVVLEASGGEEAIAITKSHPTPIHLVLTDVVMPRMSGPDLADAIRQLKPDTRFIFMSGYTEHAIVRNGMLTGGLVFINKPCLPDELIKKVREVLDRPSTP